MLLLILFFPLVESSLSRYESCRSNDCSHQLQADEGSCIIYNTSMCSQILNETHSMAFKDLKSEDESRFKVFVAPYEVTYLDSKSSLDINYFVANISITIFDKGIHQVALKLTEEKDVTKCRLFDFRNVSDSISFPVNLFYDCFHNSTSKYQFHLEFLSLSTKEKLSYDVLIPPNEEIRSLCDWRPSVVIFTGSLEQGTVRVRFSQAPPLLNVLSYEVGFVPTSKVELKTVLKIPANQNDSMLLVDFHPPFGDIYNLTISPLHLKNVDCHGAEVVSIRVGFFKYGIEMKIILYLCIVLCVIGVLFFLKYFYNYINNLESTFKPHVLLVHAVNYLEEIKLADLFGDYLSKQHGCKVSSIYGDGLDPVEWCMEKYRECNVVLIILSKGLFLTLDPKHCKPLKVFHRYCKQLIIIDQILWIEMLRPDSGFREKKICRVCFSHSSPNDTPEKMELTTQRCFKFPDEIGSFLCFLFGWKHGIRCIKYHLSFLRSRNLPSKEFEALMEGVEAVSRASKRGLESSQSNQVAVETRDDSASDNSSLFLENNLDAECSEQDRMAFIKEILKGSSTSIADESDNDRNGNESAECFDASNFLQQEVLSENSSLQAELMLRQRVNECMKFNPNIVCQDSEIGSLLNLNHI